MRLENRSDESFERVVRVAVLLYRFDDLYIAEVKRSLEGIQIANKDKVQFTFYDAKGDQSMQNKIIDEIIKDRPDLLLVNIVDIEELRTVVDKIKQTNIPVILFNREPTSLDPIRSYNKALYRGTDARQSGIMQGKIVVELWNDNKSVVDRSGDNIMQYVMLMGHWDNKDAILRTKYSIQTIKDAGIAVEELALRVADWDRLLAKRTIEALFFKYGNRIEVILANNDAMAEGAIEALQNMSYNKGDPKRTIVVVGVDATTEAQNLINKGSMAETVLQDEYELAEALYLVGMNIASGRDPLQELHIVLMKQEWLLDYHIKNIVDIKLIGYEINVQL